MFSGIANQNLLLNQPGEPEKGWQTLDIADLSFWDRVGG